MKSAFANALRKMRKSRGLSQEDFALVSSRTYLSCLECGKKSPTLDKVQAIAATMGIQVVSLIAQASLAFDDSIGIDALCARIKAEVAGARAERSAIRLLITDDHAVVREGLKQIFALVDDIVVAGEASDGWAAIDRLRRGGIDLLLLDMTMPGVSGADLIARIREHHPALPILVFSMHDEPEIAQRALGAGASGYLTKDRDVETLLDAIRRVSTGGSFVEARLAERIAA